MRQSYSSILMQGRFSQKARLVTRFIPTGCLKIAQRFNVGFARALGLNPEGTAEKIQMLSHPFGRLTVAALLASLFLTCCHTTKASRATAPKKVLVVTVTKGFRHSSIPT